MAVLVEFEGAVNEELPFAGSESREFGEDFVLRLEFRAEVNADSGIFDVDVPVEQYSAREHHLLLHAEPGEHPGDPERAIVELGSSPDALEGRLAFSEKRQPVWTAQ